MKSVSCVSSKRGVRALVGCAGTFVACQRQEQRRKERLLLLGESWLAGKIVLLLASATAERAFESKAGWTEGRIKRHYRRTWSVRLEIVEKSRDGHRRYGIAAKVGTLGRVNPV